LLSGQGRKKRMERETRVGHSVRDKKKREKDGGTLSLRLSARDRPRGEKGPTKTDSIVDREKKGKLKKGTKNG